MFPIERCGAVVMDEESDEESDEDDSEDGAYGHYHFLLLVYFMVVLSCLTGTVIYFIICLW